jgi:paraquat-inducible protein B
MPKANNARVVGAFVVVALALLIVAIALFGSARLFTESTTAVTYFEGSVAGLSVGAPVTYRGVPIGSVTRIVLEVSAKTGEARIPVFMRFTPDAVTFRGGNRLTDAARQEMLERGLRAQLVSQSLITGQLQVQLDYFPGTTPRLVHETSDVLEIPSVPSEFQEIKSRLSGLPLQAIAESALASLKSLEDMLRSPDTRTAMHDLSASLAEVRGLIAALSPRIEDTLKEADGTLAAIARTADETTDTVKSLQPKADASLTSLARVLDTAGQQTGPLIGELRAASRSIDSLAQSAQASLFTGVGMLATRSPLRQNLEDTMRNLAAASTSLRALAAELERNPNALILGRPR